MYYKKDIKLLWRAVTVLFAMELMNLAYHFIVGLLCNG
jgi:hypothetical protein